MTLLGQQLGRYRLLKLIGSGGMGEVYLAEDLSISRQVAIKIMRAELSSRHDTAALQMAARMFQREAKAIAQLDHPNILPLYSYDSQQVQGYNITYMVMPYRHEGSLDQWIKQCRVTFGLSLQDIEQIVRQAAQALQFAHDHQVIHQDVKPTNFLIRTNSEHPSWPDLQLTDFGIARLSSATSHSSSQSVRGTPAYMAPEQCEGRAVAATDQYALAVMTFEILTGRTPFLGNALQTMYAHVHTQPPTASSINPALPPAIDMVLLKALAKRPEGRFPDIASFANAFRQAVNATPLAGHFRHGDRAGIPGVAQTIPSPVTNASYSTVALEQQHTPQLNTSEKNIERLATSRIKPLVSDIETIPHREKRPHNLVVLCLISLVFLLIVVGMGLIYNAFSPPNVRTPIATKNMQNSIPITPTPTSIPNPYSPQQKLLLINDSMIDNAHGTDWEISQDAYDNACLFANGFYHVQTGVNQVGKCLSSARDYNQFVFEVKMRIISGKEGGFIFYSNTGKTSYYEFHISRDGSYLLNICRPDALGRGEDCHQHLTGGIAKGFAEKNAQGNTLAVAVNNQSIQLYINGSPLGEDVMDTTYTHGKIGLFGYSPNGTGDVAYSNARVWIP